MTTLNKISSINKQIQQKTDKEKGIYVNKYSRQKLNKLPERYHRASIRNRFCTLQIYFSQNRLNDFFSIIIVFGNASSFCTACTAHLSEYDPHCHFPSTCIFKQTKQKSLLHRPHCICLHASVCVINWQHPGHARIDGTPSTGPIFFFSACCKI